MTTIHVDPNKPKCHTLPKNGHNPTSLSFPFVGLVWSLVGSSQTAKQDILPALLPSSLHAVS